MEIKSSLLNSEDFKYVKANILQVSEKDDEGPFRVSLIEYINDSSAAEDDEFFYEMLEFTRFLMPGTSDSIAFTTPNRLIYLNAPNNKIGKGKQYWEFTYDHECLHQLWDTFGVGVRIKNEGLEYNHDVLNIASDCVINDYLVYYRKKKIPNGLVTPEFLKKEFDVEYDRKRDTQFTLYTKLLGAYNEQKEELQKVIDQLKKMMGDQNQKEPNQSQGGQGGQQSGGKGDNGQQSGGKGGDGTSDIDNMSNEQAANDAKKSADKAQEAADKAQEAADKAKSEASKSGKDSDAKKAERAQAAADKAKEAADEAKKAADEAKDALSDKDTKGVHDAAKKARKAAQKAEAAKNAAEGGDGASGDEIDNMSGKEAAESAQQSADDAKKKAEAAQKKADEASGDEKDKLQKEADKAKENADKAQDAADAAKEAAEDGDDDKAREEAKKAKQLAEDGSESKGEGGNGHEQGHGTDEGTIDDVDLEDIKNRATEIIERYKNKISGQLGEFLKKCKSSLTLQSSGLMAGTHRGTNGWNEKLNYDVNAFVKARVMQHRRQFEKTYSRLRRGAGPVRMGQPLQPGHRVKKQGLTINTAFYIDRSGSMSGCIHDVFDACYSIAEGLKKQFAREKVVDEVSFRIFAFDDYMRELKFGQRISAGGGTMNFDKILGFMKDHTKDYLVNIIITDAGFSIDKGKVDEFIKEIDGMISFVTNVDSQEMKSLADKYKIQLKYILATSDFKIDKV